MVKSKELGVKTAEALAEKLASTLNLELVEVALQKESRGKCLLFFIDKEGGLSLDDCERFHKAVIPLVENMDYDFLEVSSPGMDRPIKTARDIEKHLNQKVELKLFAQQNGSKLFQGNLLGRDDKYWIIENDANEEMRFLTSAVATVRPVIDVEGADYSLLDVE